MGSRFVQTFVGVLALVLLWAPTWKAEALESLTTVSLGSSVAVKFSTLRFNRASRSFETTATLTNNSPQEIFGTIELHVTRISKRKVALSNAVGKAQDGHSYVLVKLPSAGLKSKGSIKSRVIRFRNPSNAKFTFSHHAVLRPVMRTLQVFALPSAGGDTGVGGLITSVPAGISCEDVCTGTFPHGTPVTLIAAPIAGSVFKEWSGACAAALCELRMTGNQVVTANFAPRPPSGAISLTVEPAGAREAGAQWRRRGTDAWFSSGDEERDVPVGRHVIEFKPVDGWEPPGETFMDVLIDQTGTGAETYTPAVAANLSVLAYPGHTAHHEVVLQTSDGSSPSLSLELVDPPVGLRLEGRMLSYAVPAGAPASVLSFLIKATHLASGVSYSLPGTVTVVAPDVVAEGTVTASGGEVATQTGDVRLAIPSGAVSVPTRFTVVATTLPDGAQRYDVLTEPSDVQFQTPLELHLDPQSVSSAASALSKVAPISSSARNTRLRALQQGGAEAQGFSWTSLDSGNAVLLDGQSVARNRVPKGASCNVHRGYADPTELVSISTHCMVDLVWRLSSACDAVGGFGVANRCLGRTPVVFVHGFQRFATWPFVDDGELKGDSEYWNEMPQALDAAGYAVYLFQWRTSERFEDGAADLATAIRKIHQQTGQRVHIIAHSFGGLLARTYLQGLASGEPYGDDVASLVTIGTPHSGIGPEQTVKNVRLPMGRVEWGAVIDPIPKCRQLSCYQAGLANDDTYLFRAFKDGFATFDLRGDFQVDPNSGGEIPAKLSSTAKPMPVPMLALLGLTWESSKPGGAPDEAWMTVFDEGDGLISWEGQRIHPSYSCGSEACSARTILDTSAGPALATFPKETIERVLGVPGVRSATVKAGDRIADKWWLVPDDFLRTRVIEHSTSGSLMLVADGGYRHSDSLPIGDVGGVMQMNVVKSTFADHQVLTESLAWLGKFTGLNPALRTGRRILPAGSSTNLSWDTGGYLPGFCRVSGGGLDLRPVPSAVGSVAVVVSGRTTFTLTCDYMNGVSATKTVQVEILPTGGET